MLSASADTIGTATIVMAIFLAVVGAQPAYPSAARSCARVYERVVHPNRYWDTALVNGLRPLGLWRSSRLWLCVGAFMTGSFYLFSAAQVFVTAAGVTMLAPLKGRAVARLKTVPVPVPALQLSRPVDVAQIASILINIWQLIGLCTQVPLERLSLLFSLY